MFCFSSQFRLVVKTALKLLLVFVEYTECNTILLIQAVNVFDRQRGQLAPNVVKLSNRLWSVSYICCEIVKYTVVS